MDLTSTTVAAVAQSTEVCSCGRYANGLCGVCQSPVCYERPLPDFGSSSCGQLVRGRLLCIRDRDLDEREQVAARAKVLADVSSEARQAAASAATALMHAQVPTWPLVETSVTSRITAILGRTVTRVEVLHDYGRGWRITPDGYDEVAGYSAGLLLRTDGALLLAASNYRSDITVLPSTGERFHRTAGVAPTRLERSYHDAESGAMLSLAQLIDQFGRGITQPLRQ